jgi:hypothetical protein
VIINTTVWNELNSILTKQNYKFSTLLFMNTTSNGTRRFSQCMPAFWDPMLSLGNSSQCLHLQGLLTRFTTQNTWVSSMPHSPSIITFLHASSTSTKHTYHKYLLVTGTNIISLNTPPTSGTRIIIHVCMLLC